MSSLMDREMAGQIDSVTLKNASEDSSELEYSASEVRKLLQILFPQRRLVLSQFTFFNQVGVSAPSGKTSRRGRRCYRLQDLLSIATVLALKEEGIPYKNLEGLPKVIQDNLERIFSLEQVCVASGWGVKVNLCFGADSLAASSLVSFLDEENLVGLFWSFDVSALAQQLLTAASKFEEMRFQTYSQSRFALTRPTRAA